YSDGFSEADENRTTALSGPTTTDRERYPYIYGIIHPLERWNFGGIGISGTYHGTMLSDTWYRVMFSFDLAGEIGPAKTLYKYIDGSLVGSQVLPAGIDGRWALDPYFLIMTDEDGETNAGSISRFWFEDRAITGAEAAMYGGPNIPEPATLALLGIGLLPMLKRRK
ncbi:MAG: PEP-CTERM sorting domain-containing protein, partial [Armatimonadetes bacterium]|nr:PEP-CTERM sorting domain-containing protein [Armatimonadota bacterium]